MSIWKLPIQNCGYRSIAWDKQTCLSTCNLYKPCLPLDFFLSYVWANNASPCRNTCIQIIFFHSLFKKQQCLAGQKLMCKGRVKPCTAVLPWQLLLGEVGLAGSDFLQVFLLWWIDLQRSNNFHLKLFLQLGNFADQFFCSVVLNEGFVLLATHDSDGMLVLRSPLLPAFVCKISCSVVLSSVLLNEVQH